MNPSGKKQTVTFIISASLFLLALFPPRLTASELTLAWDPNAEPDLAGYNIYYGIQSGYYDFVIDAGNVTQYTITGLEPETLYYIALTAYDTSNNESDFSNEVSGVAPYPTNAPPTADAGPDQTVNEGVTATLDASNSSDPDDGIASYLWEQTNGIPVTLSDPTAVQPTFTSPDVGPTGASLTFRLTVTDNGGLQSTDTCIVNVTWENAPPTADAGPDQTVNERVTATLDASNSSDPDDGIASYLWEQTDGIPVTLSDPTIANPAFVAPSVDASGTLLSFQVTVRDNGGLQASDEVSITVSDTSPSGSPPAQTDSEDGYAEWGCFIATAAYGSYLNPHVKILRHFRDEFLLSHSLGRKFVHLYYQYGPRIGNHIEKYDFLQFLTRQALFPLIGMSSLFNKSNKITPFPTLLFPLLCFILIFTITLPFYLRQNR
jgi:hypothetical protein